MAAGHNVTLVYSTVHGGDERAVRGLPGGVTLIPWDAKRAIDPVDDYKMLVKLILILRELKPDVVHFHNSKAGALGRVACSVLGLRNIYSPHGPAYLRTDIDLLKRLAFCSIEWMLCALGDQLVASSASELRATRFLPCRTHLINNGVDVDAIEKLSSGTPVLAPSGRFRIVLCGRIWPQKNPECVARLAAASPSDWEWLWIGDGPQRPSVEFCQRVNILGWLSPQDALATVRTADVYLQASLWEGMSFALLEAMALGRPCVVSNVTGNRDLVRTGISGFVCNTEKEFMTALKSLANDGSMRHRLGAGATSEIREHFSLSSVTKEWSSLYRSLVAKRIEFAEFQMSAPG